jgi:hypothetical protein
MPIIRAVDLESFQARSAARAEFGGAAAYLRVRAVSAHALVGFRLRAGERYCAAAGGAVVVSVLIAKPCAMPLPH